MKNQFKTSIFFLVFMALSGNLIAQEYGGSAYVYVKSEKGETRCINVEVAFQERDEGRALYLLEGNIKSDIWTSETMTSSITYDVDSFTDDNTEYSGSASAQVKYKDGRTEYLNSTVNCQSFRLIKYHLKGSLRKSGSAVFTGPIVYVIKRCN